MKSKEGARSIFRKFRSIQSTIMVSFSALMIIVVLIFLFIAVHYTNDTIYENTINYTTQIIKQVNYDIDSYMKYLMNISSSVSKNEDVSLYLYDDNQQENDIIEEKERIISQFRTIMDSRDDIYNLAVVADNGRSVLNDGQDEFTEYIDLKAQSWYQAAFQSNEGIAISTSHVQNTIKSSYKWVITLSRILVNNQTGKKEGIFFVDLNYSAISQLCNNSSIGNKGYIFILDKEENIVYHPKQELVYGGLKTEAIDAIMECEDDYLITDEGDESKIYIISKSDITGWTVVGTAYVSEILENSKQIMMLYVGAACILLLCVLLVSSFIAKEITKPIRQLRDSMSVVETGRFDQAIMEVTANNEIGSLGKSFNVMTKRIRTLMEQNIYEQKQKRKHEMKALQAQINPHFLYNTLDSIIWMSEAGKNKDVILMTSALAKLLRQSISNDKEQVTIKEEIEYLRSYLTIQKMRYKNELEYTIEVDPEINDVKMIKFVLQPLAENAIYHGLKYKEEKGYLKIRGYASEGRAYITVSDNGVGMDNDALDNLFNDNENNDDKKANHKSNGVGIPNVQKRLQLYYGKKYGVSYMSRKGEGTVVIVTVPLDSKSEYEKSDE